ncbi:hypothetical protein [Stenotrophomonas sp. PS02300]|uniref:hypothetical protein n=1 Tax=Stenotrophomonas sp. PS02300 TaxID=2991426 RepID=UPI00249CA4EC|nr:hypothetical protein [Stenotrophomonas sp. PS02300]
MSRADAMKRTTLIFIALGPVIGGIFIFAQFVVFDHPPALAELFTFGMIWMVILFAIGGYVVGAVPAAATGLLFSFVASRRTLNLVESILLGAGAGFLTSAMAVVVIALISPGAPKWNWIIPLAGALSGTLCSVVCWVLAITRHEAAGKSDARIR